LKLKELLEFDMTFVILILEHCLYLVYAIYI